MGIRFFDKFSHTHLYLLLPTLNPLQLLVLSHHLRHLSAQFLHHLRNNLLIPRHLLIHELLLSLANLRCSFCAGSALGEVVLVLGDEVVDLRELEAEVVLFGG